MLPRLRSLFLLLALVVPSLLVMGAENRAHRPKLVLLIAEHEYETARTLPPFAAEFLAADFTVVTVTAPQADGNHVFSPADEIATADVLLVSVRRRTPPQATMDLIRRHVAAGKALVGIRTASHAFSLRGTEKPAAGFADWPEFDRSVIGGNYAGHHGHGPITQVTPVSAAAKHPILEGVTMPFTSGSWLYRNTPLRDRAEPLLMGEIPGQRPEPVAWTFRREDGGRTFYTSLGAADDFKNPSFQQLLRNGTRWAAGLLVAEKSPSAISKP